MENVNWGVPTKNRNKKTERWSNPVITLHLVEKKGSNRRFTFNKAAREALNVVGGETFVAFGFTEEDIFIKAFDAENPATFTVNKSFGFRDAKTYNYLVNRLNLDTNVDNELHFTMNNDGCLKYTLVSSDNDEVVETYNVENTPKTATVNVKGEEVELVEPVVNESTDESAEDLESQW